MPAHNFSPDLLQPTPEVSSTAHPPTQDDPRQAFYGWPLDLVGVFHRHPHIFDMVRRAIQEDIDAGVLDSEQ